MSATAELYGIDKAYDLGDGTAPAGTTDQVGGRAPVGTWPMVIADFKIEMDRVWKWKDQPDYIGPCARLTLRVTEGPHVNKTATEFYPMPYRSVLMNTGRANQWVHLVQALGHELPKQIGPDGKPHVTSLIPPGFAGPDALQRILLNRPVMVKLIEQRDASGQPKLDNNGEPYIQPALFGYSRYAAGGGTAAAAGGNGGSGSAAQSAAASVKLAPAPSEPSPGKADFDL